jgi:hypothetical protein
MNNVNWCSNNVTTKTYVTGITIYNTLTRFICLSTACTLSTKLARLAYKKIWRSEGKQVIMLLDDGLGIEEDDELCKAVVLSSSPHAFKFYTLLP